MTNIEKMMQSLAITHGAMLAEMQRVYPVGTRVNYRLRGGADAHRYPVQVGEIIGYKGGFDARFKIRLAPSRHAKAMGHDDSRRYETTIPLKKIIGIHL